MCIGLEATRHPFPLIEAPILLKKKTHWNYILCSFLAEYFLNDTYSKEH